MPVLPGTNSDEKNHELLRNLFPDPPENPMIATLFVGCIDEDIPEEEIRKAFEEYGTIKDVRMIQKRSCAFIDYSNRSAAEEAVKSLWGTFTINGCQLRVEWANSERPDSMLLKK
jgi:RNA recognition motif-containing protein